MLMVDVAANLASVHERMAAACTRSGREPETVTLVAITKTVPTQRIVEAYRAGARHFGENRVQEARQKLPALRDLSEAVWHMVGGLQVNKVNTALGLFDIIESVDSHRLASALNERAHGRLPVLLEVNVGGEPQKSGLLPEDLAQTLDGTRGLARLDVRGLMTIAPAVPQPEDARPYFRRLRELAQGLGLPELSMGMTDDFEVAIEEGATMVRIGRAIFGPRYEGR
jgi:pyridoxal phosphate enzyme (YggS family)